MTWRAAALLALICVVLGVSTTSATIVNKPVTKGLGHGAFYQAPLGKRSCYGSHAGIRLEAHRCTLLAQLKGANATTPLAVAADSRAIYAASGGGVLVLNSNQSGDISFNSCAVITSPCGVYENDEGATVKEIDVGPGGRQLYVLIDRAQEEGTEIHAMAIGSDHGLSPDPSCLLLIPTQTPGVPTSNPRTCKIDTGDDRYGGEGLVLTPDGRFAYLISSSRTPSSNIVEMSRDANGSLSVLPGCVSGHGGHTFGQAGQCETTLPVAQAGEDFLNLRQLAPTPDSAGLVVRGDNRAREPFLVRFTIDADGHLTRSRSASACVNPSGKYGCARSTALFEDVTPMAIARNRVYVGTSTYTRSYPDTFTSKLLGYELTGDGGLSLPAGAAGCAGNVTTPRTRITKVADCSLGREGMRHPYLVFTGPRGDTVYVLGFIISNSHGIAPFKLGSSGAPAPVKGPSGCLLDGTLFTRERTPCNRVFARETLADAELTFALAPDGRSAYVLSQVRPSDVDRLVVLQRVP